MSQIKGAHAPCVRNIRIGAMPQQKHNYLSTLSRVEDGCEEWCISVDVLSIWVGTVVEQGHGRFD